MSVVRYDFITDHWRNKITKDEAQNTIAADGLPLQVIGNLTIPVVLGEFRTEHRFTVVGNLCVECILGADFLVKHSAVIDCKANTLVLGEVPRITVAISIALNETSPPLLAQAEKVVSMIDTVVIPPRSITQLVAEVQSRMWAGRTN